MGQWIDRNVPYLASGTAALALFLWGWWVIHHLNGWADVMNGYIRQTDQRFQHLERQLREHYHEPAPAADVNHAERVTKWSAQNT